MGSIKCNLFSSFITVEKNRSNLGVIAEGKHLPDLRDFLGMVLTFILTIFAWIFFRAKDVGHAIDYISGIFTVSFFEMPNIPKKFIVVIVLIVFFLFVEWFGRMNQFAIEKLFIGRSKFIRWGAYYFIVLLIGLFMKTVETPFIYFQF